MGDELVTLTNIRHEVRGVGEAVLQIREDTEAARSQMIFHSLEAQKSANNADLRTAEVLAEVAEFQEIVVATMSKRQRRKLQKYYDRVATKLMGV